MNNPLPYILIRGGGDLASGVALRLWRSGFRVAITEVAQPLAVRRLVAFAEAVYQGQVQFEGLTARLATNPAEVADFCRIGQLPVLVDPDCRLLSAPGLQAMALVDARMLKRPPQQDWLARVPCFIGLGPGFCAGENCHAVVETNRGHHLGRVIWQGTAEPDTGLPETVSRYQGERVLRAPTAGILQSEAELGSHIAAGAVIATVARQPVLAPFNGVLRGLLHPDLEVYPGMKIGDLDPRDDPAYATQVSDKALAIGGGVLEALLSQPVIRRQLCA